jgi:hypothetical protein
MVGDIPRLFINKLNQEVMWRTESKGISCNSIIVLGGIYGTCQTKVTIEADALYLLMENGEVDSYKQCIVLYCQ